MQCDSYKIKTQYWLQMKENKTLTNLQFFFVLVSNPTLVPIHPLHSPKMESYK